MQATEGRRKDMAEVHKKRGQASNTRLIGMSSELNGTQTLLLFSLSSLFCLPSMMSCASQQKIKPGYGPTFQRDLQTSVCPAQSTISQQRCTVLDSSPLSLPLSLSPCHYPSSVHSIPLSLCTDD